MKAFALKNGKKTLAVSLNQAELWRKAKQATTRNYLVGGWVTMACDKAKLREDGWDVVEIDFKVLS